MLLDHFSMRVADYKKEAAYFAALMNWKIRSDDGTKAVLDIGDWGGIVIHGGYQPPAPAGATGGGRAAATRRGWRGGRGGAAAGRGGAAADVAAARRRGAVFDGFCWGIAPWDTKKVEAELKKRGLDPVADHDGKDFQSFHVKDPGGFDLQISNGNPKNRRTTPANAIGRRAGAVRADELEDGVARPHLLSGGRLQGERRVLSGVARLEARRR